MSKLIAIGIFIVILVIIGFYATNTQWFTKSFGGTTELQLQKGKKLINITWKGDNLWYITRDMKKSDSAETYTFQESSNLSVAQGLVIIHEQK
ncbi:MAG: hypothetical protein WCQ32_01880 [bacterium]